VLLHLLHLLQEIQEFHQDLDLLLELLLHHRHHLGLLEVSLLLPNLHLDYLVKEIQEVCSLLL
tara:strand:- start:256 stop:444 length:189 start_codon:yes stop_codon:yes gene_type:complete